MNKEERPAIRRKEGFKRQGLARMLTTYCPPHLTTSLHSECCPHGTGEETKAWREKVGGFESCAPPSVLIFLPWIPVFHASLLPRLGEVRK